MEKKIGKVTLDFSAYTGKDRYSDGDIELEILAALKEGRAERILMEDHRWPVFYHLAPERENRTLDVHIRTLRAKLGEAGKYIETVRGVGYRLQAPGETK